MSRINVDIDDWACEKVMRRYGLNTKAKAVNFALRALAVDPLSEVEVRRLREKGCDGDLDVMRSAFEP